MKKKDTNSFEKKIFRLEEISDMLEDETTQLEEAIKLFEEGIDLSKDCITTLKNAELKITELKAKIDAVNPEGKKATRKNNSGDNENERK